MEGRGKPPLNAPEAIMKKPRSVASRKPKSAEQLASDYNGSLCAPSLNASRDDDDAGIEAGGHRRKELYLNSPEMKGSMAHRSDSSKKGSVRAGGDCNVYTRSSKSKDTAKRDTEGVLALECTGDAGSPDNPVLVPRDAHVPGEHRLRKLKLKVGGVTRTLHAKTSQEVGDGGTATTDASFQRQNQKDYEAFPNKETHSQSSDVRKSKRISKKKALDSDSDDEDDELRYLEKLRGIKVAPEHPVTADDVAHDDYPDGFKKKTVSKASKNKGVAYEVDEDFADFTEEEEHEIDENDRLNEVDPPSDAKTETPGLTTRQRALQGRGGHGGSLIEFPDGLPTSSSRKNKEKLSDVEVQAKKAEAAQRRKMQVEKAEKEQQAEAIRKILGLDSEKKKEEQKQKEQEEKEKQAKLEEYRKNCIRTVIGPNGTTVSFPESVGLPSILNSKPVSYPPPREKCAGPGCTNPYKYRHSKLLVPLCSLACYKAVEAEAKKGEGSGAGKGEGSESGKAEGAGSGNPEGSEAGKPEGDGKQA